MTGSYAYAIANAVDIEIGVAQKRPGRGARLLVPIGIEWAELVD
jgi:hypothetical protein